MTLQLYNTASRSIEAFSSTDQKVRLYTCGPTVYDSPHVGNWVAYIYWDTLIRTLTASGLSVTRVMNITDVGHLVSDGDEGEDKLEKGARREGKTAWQIAEYYTVDFMRGMQKLGLTPPDHIAKATDFINQQLDLVRTLKDKGYTYQISDGIYFDTAKFPRYSDFAKLNTEEQKAGARVEFNPEKRNPSDFALWKFTPQGVTRDMEWETPDELLEGGIGKMENGVTKGFPGWHLECSAIAMDSFGPTLDIHTGGIDHIPVHHTNEIAQSEAATGETFSRFWLHNNHMKVDGSKISKSLGNGYTLEDLEAKGFSPLDFRLLVLQSHYQSEANFSFDNLQSAKNRRGHWRAIAALRWQTPTQPPNTVDPNLQKAGEKILESLSDNLNTAGALAVVDEAFSHVENQPISQLSHESLNQLLVVIDNLLGLQLIGSTPNLTESQTQLINDREAARISKDWSKSDQLREELLRQGIRLNDTPTGAIWSYDD